MGPDPDTDLHWLAFLYVCCELSDDETASFEARLVHDQAAREAVAASVELAGSIGRASQAASPKVIPMRSGRSWSALAWAASALAACLALAVGLSLPRRPEPRIPRGLPAEIGPMRDVALAWSGLRREDGGHPADLPSWLVESPSIHDADLPAEADDGDSGPPSWLIVAASLRDKAAPAPAAPEEN